MSESELLRFDGHQDRVIHEAGGRYAETEVPLDISYLSDAVLMLRYFEHAGTVRRALSVVKKRSGDHEHTIREFKLTIKA